MLEGLSWPGPPLGFSALSVLHSKPVFYVALLHWRAGCVAASSGGFPAPRRAEAEERSFWDVPDVYLNLSPFRHAKKIAERKTPLLLIHGDNDENSGTFPLQSERLYQARPLCR